MKAIIIAAGRGKRMNELTDDLPKCLLEFNKKTLLQSQFEAFRSAGVKDISVIVGYKKEKIDYPGLKYYVNERYLHNDILHSLFCAQREMDDEFIASYSDILFDAKIAKRLLNCKKDIAILVDTDWRAYYKGRKDHPIDEAENVIMDSDKKVLKIGKALGDKNAVHGEFVGMIKCTKKGAAIFRNHFNKIKPIYDGKPFQRAPVFEKAYLTDMVQDLADSGIAVHCVTVKGGWREIDTVEDYKKALSEIEKIGCHDNRN
ncbi:MAG: phosphocholine cytidylyltransferase family protein [Candidatus Omnitrophota bacterium]